MKKISVYLIIVMLFVSYIPLLFNQYPVHAASSIFVSTTGDDVAGDGSIGNPYRTIHRALNASSAGDTVYIRAGYYYGVYYWTGSGGTAGNPITITNYNSENVVINENDVAYGGGGSWVGQFHFQKQHYLVIDGLKFYNATKFAIFLEEGASSQYIHNITIQNCYFENTSDGAIHTDAYSPHTHIYDIIFRDNICYNNNNAWYDVCGQECISMFQVKRFYIYNNTISLNWKICIDAKANSEDGEIYNNTINTSHPNGNPYAKAGLGNWYNNGGGITLDGASTYVDDINVHENIIYGNKTGITISTESGGNAQNISIYNNIINITGSTSWSGIILWHKTGVAGQYKDNVSIFHNTIYTSTSKGIYIDEWDTNIQNLLIANNIIDTNQNTIGIDWLNVTTNHTITNNLFNVSASDTFGSNSVIGEPLFIDPGTDFDILQSSPAVDAGSNTYTTSYDFDGTFRPQNVIVDIGAFEFGPVISNWWDNDWLYKKRITIDHEQVTSTLTNFPIFINLSSDSDLVSHVGYSDGRDIAFIDSTETAQYNHEIEYFDDSTGRLVAWVNVTSLSSTEDTILYMYFGNNNCVNQSDPANTWDSNYLAVWHMNGNSYFNIKDSTTYNHDANAKTSNPVFNEEAICGHGVSFDGTDDRIEIADSADMSFRSGTQDQPFTMEAVFKISDYNINAIISKYVSDANREWVFYGRESPQNLRMRLWDSTEYETIYRDTTGTIGTTRYYYCAATYDGSETYQGVLDYVNGVNDSGVGYKDVHYNCMRDTSAKLIMGYIWGVPSSHYYKGVIDEIRISDITRSADWIETTYNTIFNGTSGGFFFIGEGVLLSVVEEPTSFIASTDENGYIDLSWAKGSNSTNTYIEYNTVSNWVRGSGTLLYNDTGTASSLMDVSCNILYYFIAWAYNSSSNSWSSGVSTNNISCPGNPTNIVSYAYTSAINITWTSNIHADTTLVIRKSNSYPTSVTDGTEICNTTNNTWNDTGVVYGVSYYTLFTYNETVNRYSAGYDVQIGSLNINVYDENTSAAITNWDVFISNEAGTQVYESNGNSNTLVINIDDLPLGDVTIVINQSDYVTRIFDMTLVSDNSYFLDVYLAWNDSVEQYTMYVVGPENEYGYEPPIEDATITIKRYINESTGWGNVTIRKTSASGTINIGLIPLKQYHVTITKNGYETFYDVIVPPPIELEGDRYFKFRLVYAGTTQPTTDDFWDYIIFKATMTSPGYLQNGNITIRYNDLNTSTTNTRTYLYEVYNGVTTLKDNYYQTGDSFTRKVGSINTTRYHYVKLYFNNTASFTVTPPIILPVYSIHKYVGETILDLDTRIKNVVGDPPIGTDWVILIAVVVPMILLVLFGVFNTGIGIISCGLSMGLVQGIFAGYGLDVSISLFALSPFIIVIGVIYLWSKRGMEDHL